MKIIENCWNQIDTYNCQYGAHIFDGFTAKIYVHHWLAVYLDQSEHFFRKNDEGFVGHCILVFKGVKSFDFSVNLVGNDEGNTTLVQPPINWHYEGITKDATTKYIMEGSLHGFPSSVDILIEAQKFELHILDKDEPAQQS